MYLDQTYKRWRIQKSLEGSLPSSILQLPETPLVHHPFLPSQLARIANMDYMLPIQTDTFGIPMYEATISTFMETPTDQLTNTSWSFQGNGMIYESVEYPIFALNPIDPLSLTAYNQIMNVSTSLAVI